MEHVLVHYATDPRPGSVAALVAGYATACAPFRIPYTFSEQEVTCPACLERMKPRRRRHPERASALRPDGDDTG